MGHYVIVGGGGFLGAHVISALQKIGCKERIIVVDPCPQEFKTIKIDKSNISYIKASFLDDKVLENILNGASAVVHLAAVGHTGLIAGDRKSVHNFNVNGTKQLIKQCKALGVKRFLYASSVAVSFIGEPLDNVTEDDPLPDPKKYLDFYSASKAEAETYVLSQSTPDFKTVCLRFRGIYGPEDPNVTLKVANLIKNGLFIGMVSAHGRESVSCASSGVNCAKAFALADQMLQNPDGLHGRAYYILDGENVGQFQFWTPLVLALGKQPPSFYTPYDFIKAVVPYFQNVCYGVFKLPPLLTKFELSILAVDNTYSIERARRELGYEPEPCVMTDVAKYYQDLEENEVATATTEWKSAISILIVFISIAFLFLFNLN